MSTISPQQLSTLDPQNPQFDRQLVETLVEAGCSTVPQLEAQLTTLIAELDQLLSEQLSAIIQAPEFKALEALWRNLSALLDNDYSRSVKVRILDLSWPELAADLNLSRDLSYSALYRKIYTEEFSTAGGEPYGLLLIDHPASMELDDDSGFDDLFTLQLLGQLGHDALCPVLLPVATDFLGTDDVDVWTDPARVQRILDSADFAPWQALREQNGSQFIGLTLPRLLVRKPWRNYAEGFVFNEVAADKPGDELLWGNSSFAFAANVMREFNRIHWFGFLRASGDGVDAAIVNARRASYDHHLIQPICEIRFTDQLEECYAEQGFIPLSTCYLTGKVGIFSNRSVFRPLRRQASDEVNAMLQTTLLACRFGHYLKVKIRNKIGGYRTASECERELNSWLQTYCSNVDYADDAILARYPLKKAAIRISGDDRMASYHCEVEMLPQYQFDYLASNIMLKTDLGSIGGTTPRGGSV